jgi:hypothetical protein
LPDSPQDTVLVFRNGAGEAIAVPADIVTEAQRAFRCYTLQLKGLSWSEIAELEKYPSAGAALADVSRYMAEAKALVVEATQRDLLTLEVERLNIVQRSLWDNMLSGHVPSAVAIVNVIMRRSELLGLDAERMRDEGNRARTVVVPADDGYTAGLKLAAAQHNTTTIAPPEGEPDGTDT